VALPVARDHERVIVFSAESARLQPTRTSTLGRAHTAVVANEKAAGALAAGAADGVLSRLDRRGGARRSGGQVLRWLGFATPPGLDPERGAQC
jgi:hypothetical protein